MKRAFFLVNGINTFPGSSKNWNGRGVTYIHAKYESEPWKAEKIEYFCGPIGRAFGQRNRADKLYRTLSFYRRYDDRVIIAHSNGCDVAVSMLQQHIDWPNISHLHLVCGATNANFNENGLNKWLMLGRIQHVHIYCARFDHLLRLAHSWAGQLLGYDGQVGLHHRDATLGLHGPTAVDKSVRNRVHVIKDGRWLTYGHSDCWHDDNFDGTMANFMVI